MPRAPDCDTNAAAPNGGIEGAKVALSDTAGSAFSTPMQFGPTMRMRWRCTISTSCRSAAAPASPTSLKPAEITTRPRTRLVPHCSATVGTCSAGTTITARSTGSGISRTDGYALIEWTLEALGLTGNAAPVKPYRSMGARISLPMVSGRRDAPMTATARGRRIGSRSGMAVKDAGGVSEHLRTSFEQAGRGAPAPFQPRVEQLSIGGAMIPDGDRRQGAQSGDVERECEPVAPRHQHIVRVFVLGDDRRCGHRWIEGSRPGQHVAQVAQGGELPPERS